MDIDNRENRFSLVEREKKYDWPKVIGITTGGIALTYVFCYPVSRLFEKKDYIDNNQKQSFKYLKSSYIPVTNAIVPPETPGMTFAAPIATPFKKRLN